MVICGRRPEGKAPWKRSCCEGAPISGVSCGGAFVLSGGQLISGAKNLIIAKDSCSVARGTAGCAMATKRRRSFDTKSFLARVGDGQSIGKYRKGQTVF